MFTEKFSWSVSFGRSTQELHGLKGIFWRIKYWKKIWLVIYLITSKTKKEELEVFVCVCDKIGISSKAEPRSPSRKKSVKLQNQVSQWGRTERSTHVNEREQETSVKNNPVPLSPKSDKHLISLYSITSWSYIQIMRIKEMITRHEMSWCLIKFSQLVK